MQESTVSFADRIRACAQELARNGAAALGPFYDLSARRAVRYALMLTRDQHDAEDATQAALVRVAMHPKVLAKAQYPWAYFLRIVRNEALLITRRRRRESPRATLPDVVSQVTDELIERDVRREVWRAIQKLPAAQAEVVVLKIWEDMTFADIARVLDRSPNTVASRYQYAVQKLAVSLRSLGATTSPSVTENTKNRTDSAIRPTNRKLALFRY